MQGGKRARFVLFSWRSQIQLSMHLPQTSDLKDSLVWKLASRLLRNRTLDHKQVDLPFLIGKPHHASWELAVLDFFWDLALIKVRCKWKLYVGWIGSCLDRFGLSSRFSCRFQATTVGVSARYMHKYLILVCTPWNGLVLHSSFFKPKNQEDPHNSGCCWRGWADKHSLVRSGRSSPLIQFVRLPS